jgi:collagenase-like PrtC family protease
MELVCPAGTPAALRAAVEAGADTVYAGFRDETNARNFPGLNFNRKEMAEAARFVHEHGRQLYIAINTFPRAGDEALWHDAVAAAAGLGADAVILADIGLLDYAARRHPELRRHLSVQAAASHFEAIRFYARAFGIKRVVLPRVLTVAEVSALNRRLAAEGDGVETEVFAFGGMCPMAEGRCSLSSYITGESPNMSGVCSPASHVRYEERDGELVSLLAGSTINRFAPGEAAGYPTLCKGRFVAHGRASYLFEEPTSLNTAEILGDLKAAGVAALKIEGRQRGRAYTAVVVGAFRRLIDSLEREADQRPAIEALKRLAEGQRDTTGAFGKAWR